MEVIDLQELKDSTVASKIWNCFINTGFLQIINHGIKTDIFNKTYKAAEIFFQMSIDEKLKCVHIDKARRGYSPVSTENFGSLNGDANMPNDSVEKFRVGPPNNEADADQVSSIYTMNNWENTPCGFRESLELYYSELDILSRRLLQLIAIGGGIEENFFVDKMKQQTSILTLNYYSKISDENLESLIRVAEHTDVSLITIVSLCIGMLFVYDCNRN